MADTNWSDFTDVASLLDTDVLLLGRGAGGINALAGLLAYKAGDGIFKAQGNGLAIGPDLSSFTLNGAQVPNYGLGVYSNIVALGGYAGLKFHAGQAERMTISQGGNVGIGVSAPGEKLHVAGSILLANNQSNKWLNTFGFTGARAIMQSDNNFLFYSRTASGGEDAIWGVVTGQATGQHRFVFYGGAKSVVGQDGATALGEAGARWSTVYAATGTINTSDQREKIWIGIREDSRAVWLRIARRIFGELGFYQWASAVEEKGEDGARWHFGARAQRVWQIVADEELAPPLIDGLPDPAWTGPPPPAFLCFDQWEAEHSEEPVYSATLVGEDGKPLKTGTRAVVSREAGNRFGFRIDQLGLLLDWSLHVEQEALRSENVDLSRRISALEGVSQ